VRRRLTGFAGPGSTRALFLAITATLLLPACNAMKAPWEPSSADRARSEDVRRTAGDSADRDTVDPGQEGSEGSDPGTRGLSPEAIEAMRAAAGGDDADSVRRAVSDSGRAADSTDREIPTTVEGLRDAGPTFMEYDQGPVLERSARLTNLLESRLLPVIEEHDLSPRISTLFWVLVDEDGTVADALVHTTSTVEAFDEAAAEVARSLEYEPARRAGERVPVWVLTRVHLLMP
jgi:TonB family protein